jgi:hypothetical protein
MINERTSHWQKDADKVAHIIHDGMVVYVARLEGLDLAFSENPKTLRCIDERVNGNVALAGSGILMGVEATVAALRQAGIEAVTSHIGCGAVALYCQDQGIAGEDIDQTAQDFARQVANKLGVPYTDHQPVDPQFHIARVIYYTSAPTFNPQLVEGLPTGFVISRSYHLDATAALKEVAIAIGIATGDHGFGNLFTSDQPLLLIALDDARTSTFSLAQLRRELEGLVAQHPQRDILRIEGFSAL